MTMKLMLLTGEEKMIREAESIGIDRIFLDLEYINKNERQKGRNTFISTYTIDDVARVRLLVKKAELLVRVNPINPNSEQEIDRVIRDGADIVMLPMIIDSEDVKEFIRIVNKRAKVCLLLETAQTVVRLEEILEIDGIDEIYIGLNDLQISMGLSFMFESLSGGLIEYMCEKIKNKGIPYGFGGIAKIGEGLLPAEKILGEHYRLGSTSVILSRTFRNERNHSKKNLELSQEILKIRNTENEIKKWSTEDHLKNKNVVKTIVASIVENLNSQKKEQ